VRSSAVPSALSRRLFYGHGANYLVKGARSWSRDLSVRLAGTLHVAPYAVFLLDCVDRQG
jgi:hypothetical protein